MLVSERSAGQILPSAPLVDIEVPDQYSALRDRVGPGRMTRDDVAIVQGLYRPGFVSQRNVAGIIQVDQFMLINDMRARGSQLDTSYEGKTCTR
jgi:hypothetical protein